MMEECDVLLILGSNMPYLDYYPKKAIGIQIDRAIAAQLAYPRRQCIAMVGDGSFTMLMGEMATAVLYSLPVKIIIFKNNTLAMDAFEQEEIGGKQFGIALHPINFVKIAEACGAEGYSCSNPLELPAVLNKAFASNKPAVIEVDVNPDAPPDPPEKIK